CSLLLIFCLYCIVFFQAEDGIRDDLVTGVQTCALPIYDFVNAIRAVLGPRSGPPDFARLFQALRIAVNEEIETLVTALPAFRDEIGRASCRERVEISAVAG